MIKIRYYDPNLQLVAILTVIIVLFFVILFSTIFILAISLPTGHQGRIITHNLCKQIPAWAFIENSTDSWCDERIFMRPFDNEYQCPCFSRQHQSGEEPSLWPYTGVYVNHQCNAFLLFLHIFHLVFHKNCGKYTQNITTPQNFLAYLVNSIKTFHQILCTFYSTIHFAATKLQVVTIIPCTMENSKEKSCTIVQCTSKLYKCHHVDNSHARIIKIWKSVSI